MLERIFHETPAERARHYRVLAMTAEANAAATPLPSLRAAFLRSAERWNTLAALLEMGKGYSPRKVARPNAPQITRTRNVHANSRERTQELLPLRSNAKS